MSITVNRERVGNFTSSEIANLLKVSKDGKSFGAPALTYIEEKNMERRLNRCLDADISAKPTTWGNLLEKRVFNILGPEYVASSQQTRIHPRIKYWSGSSDGIKNDKYKTVIDIKCPITLKSFCQLVQPLYEKLSGKDAMDYIRKNHPSGEKYYFQLVSNSIIERTKYAELIIYMPFESELEEIKFMAQNIDGVEASKHYWIGMALDGELPYLKDGGFYRNVNVIRFTVPNSDKKLLRDAVLKAGKMLVKPPKIYK